MRRTVPWFGLFLLAASFVWFVLIPPEKEVAVKQPIHRPAFAEPFSIVVFDPGHGGQDSGAICGNVLEKDLTLDVGRRAEQLVRAQGLQTVMTRSDDHYVSLGERAAIANRQRNCIFVSIHFNDVKRAAVSGVETYYALPAIAGAAISWSWLPFGQQMLTEPPNAVKARAWRASFRMLSSLTPRRSIAGQSRNNFTCSRMPGTQPCWWKPASSRTSPT